eukprot:TRINITY_DN56259_c0_g1_i1.p1 TRINITY_DN56259_c0_g1~~TRINITY_DN56259_c0_g1_i1.p1  ORF type:complete len:184 (+),score=15.60 TRINITY_DN56259_c0_g1_i1:55-606(+)
MLRASEVRLHELLRTSTRNIFAVFILLLSVSFRADSYRSSRRQWDLPQLLKIGSEDHYACVDIVITDDTDDKSKSTIKRYKAFAKGWGPGSKTKCGFEDAIYCDLSELRFTCTNIPHLGTELKQLIGNDSDQVSHFYRHLYGGTDLRYMAHPELLPVVKNELPSPPKSACCEGEVFEFKQTGP